MEKFIRSFIDIDWYKFTMLLFVLRYYPDVRVKYSFINRSKHLDVGGMVKSYLERTHTYLDEHILQYMKMFPGNDVRLFKHKAHFVSNNFPQKSFNKVYSNTEAFAHDLIERYGIMDNINIDYNIVYNPETKHYDLDLTLDGLWANTILYETVIMGVIKEIYAREHIYQNSEGAFNDIIIHDALPTLLDETFYLNVSRAFPFTEFGTRRRLTFDWQMMVNRIMKTYHYTQYKGSSNVEISWAMNQRPVGTMAHELFMVIAGVNDNLRGESGILETTHEVLTKWHEFYEDAFNVALPDTFGTIHFLEVFREDNLYNKYIGTRQDSGDPFMDGHRKVSFYNSLGVNPLEKQVFFSDSLNFKKAIELAETFNPLIMNGYGIGTFLTSNTKGISNPSIVVKAVEANGEKLVKLSDNISKATGDPEQVERYKRIFRYVNKFSEVPVA